MKITWIRWTFECWVTKDLEEVIGNTFRTRQELYDAQESHSGKYCNCGERHKALKLEITIKE